jgi:hypothetical protein
MYDKEIRLSFTFEYLEEKNKWIVGCGGHGTENADDLFEHFSKTWCWDDIASVVCLLVNQEDDRMKTENAER